MPRCVHTKRGIHCALPWCTLRHDSRPCGGIPCGHAWCVGWGTCGPHLQQCPPGYPIAAPSVRHENTTAVADTRRRGHKQAHVCAREKRKHDIGTGTGEGGLCATRCTDPSPVLQQLGQHRPGSKDAGTEEGAGGGGTHLFLNPAEVNSDTEVVVLDPGPGHRLGALAQLPIHLWRTARRKKTVLRPWSGMTGSVWGLSGLELLSTTDSRSWWWICSRKAVLAGECCRWPGWHWGAVQNTYLPLAWAPISKLLDAKAPKSGNGLCPL